MRIGDMTDTARRHLAPVKPPRVSSSQVGCVCGARAMPPAHVELDGLVDLALRPCGVKDGSGARRAEHAHALLGDARRLGVTDDVAGVQRARVCFDFLAELVPPRITNLYGSLLLAFLPDDLDRACRHQPSKTNEHSWWKLLHAHNLHILQPQIGSEVFALSPSTPRHARVSRSCLLPGTVVGSLLARCCIPSKQQNHAARITLQWTGHDNNGTRCTAANADETLDRWRVRSWACGTGSISSSRSVSRSLESAAR